jgi:hypothetical protein
MFICSTCKLFDTFAFFDLTPGRQLQVAILVLNLLETFAALDNDVLGLSLDALGSHEVMTSLLDELVHLPRDVIPFVNGFSDDSVVFFVYHVRHRLLVRQSFARSLMESTAMLWN